MKREQLSKIICDIDDRLIAEAYHFDPGRCSDSSERIAHMKRKKIVSIALVAALTLALGSAAVYAAQSRWLKDLVVQSSAADPAAPAEDQNEYEYYESEPSNVISLQGYSESPEHQAMLKWHEFLGGYDPTGEILSQVGNNATPWDDKYNANGYGIYSQEMADKLDSIAAEYGLTLHSGGLHTANSMADLYDRFGRFCAAENYGGYYFDDGTFQCDCEYDGRYFQLRRCTKGMMDTVSLGVDGTNKYEQWEYLTSCGTTVLLVSGSDRALIVADLPGSFVTVDILYFAQSDPEDVLSARELESFADTIDFSIL